MCVGGGGVEGGWDRRQKVYTNRRTNRQENVKKLYPHFSKHFIKVCVIESTCIVNVLIQCYTR